MGQTMWICGTGEAYIGSYETNYGIKRADFLGQEKFELGHNKANYGANQDDIFGTGEVDIRLYQDVFWD